MIAKPDIPIADKAKKSAILPNILLGIIYQRTVPNNFPIPSPKSKSGLLGSDRSPWMFPSTSSY